MQCKWGLKTMKTVLLIYSFNILFNEFYVINVKSRLYSSI
jgi:hypothetical protein